MKIFYPDEAEITTSALGFIILTEDDLSKFTNFISTLEG